MLENICGNDGINQERVRHENDERKSKYGSDAIAWKAARSCVMEEDRRSQQEGFHRKNTERICQID